MNIETLEKLNDCSAALAWVRTAGHSDDLAAAWLTCQRGDWLLWFAAKRGVDRKIIVRAACECARLALHHAKSPTVLACIETSEAWTRGKATIEQVREARYAAYAAYDAYAAFDYDADDADDARASTLAQCADIVRQHIPILP
jgi:hypothetical protein